MQVVIFAGGFGTRLSEETTLRPKPMVEIGGKPIIWHIMKIFSQQGFNDFIICCGYKSYMIKEYFSNYSLYTSDITLDLNTGKTTIHKKNSEPWRITLVDTGETSLTGRRLQLIKNYIHTKKFFLTYGDGLANINLSELIDCHEKSKKSATVTAVQQPGRFGALEISNNGSVSNFEEKPIGDGAWINGGYFLLNDSIFEYLSDENVSWESSPLRSITKSEDLNAYLHRGFWQPMDTLRDKGRLEELWQSNLAPWKIW